MKWRLKERMRNAARSFRPGEFDYKLSIERIDGLEVAFRQGTADEKVIRHILRNANFFNGVPEYAPGPEDVVVDIGAHIGTFALLSASKSPRGRVHAVEASRETFNYLRVNAALNAGLPISTYHLALSDRDGEVRLHHDRGSWGHSITARLSNSGETVRSATLATFFDEQGIGAVDFMKFNCEGAEFPILMSAPEAVLAAVRRMLVLYHLDRADGASLEALLEKLQRAGFRTELRNQRPTRGWIVAQR
jgi:FkbM family methyltransferase